VERYNLRKTYPEVSHGKLNPYHFICELYRQLSSNDVVVCGDGTACVATFQVGTVHGDQRLFTNSGCASMGYDLPAAIGAAFARGGGRVICLAGDGSLHLNIQELQTLKHHQLNIKLFVINNGGYLSIRQTQKSYFGRLVGEGPQSGLTFPDYRVVGEAYGLPTMAIDADNYRARLAEALAMPGPVLCEVFVDSCQEFEPKLSSRILEDGRMVSSPLEDLSPFLDRKELAENMLVPMVGE
jgi:acetolactate synthase-1/2/3 large subunit